MKYYIKTSITIEQEGIFEGDRDEAFSAAKNSCMVEGIEVEISQRASFYDPSATVPMVQMDEQSKQIVRNMLFGDAR